MGRYLFPEQSPGTPYNRHSHDDAFVDGQSLIEPISDRPRSSGGGGRGEYRFGHAPQALAAVADAAPGFLLFLTYMLQHVVWRHLLS